MKIRELVLAMVLGLGIPWLIYNLMEDTIPISQLQADMQEKETEAVDGTIPTNSQEVIMQVLMPDQTVEQMPLESYVAGVVLAEMPADFELEALKAQAVAARTYALKRYHTGQKHAAGVVCTDPACCQAYCSRSEYLGRGNGEADADKVYDAAEQTAGLVLMYGGQLIDATYFSCSGGQTEDALAVWGKDIPYLQSVTSPGEEAATHYIDTVSYTRKEVEQKLQRELTGDWLGSVSYTEGGGVDEIVIGGTSYKGTEIRTLLGLRSTAFLMTAVGDTVTVTTKGYGHRVGLSQYGADAMAVGGSDFEEILYHYYPGAILQTYEP